MNQEIEFKSKLEQDQKLISKLKQDNESLHGQKLAQQIEYSERKADNQQFIDINQVKTAELTNLKGDSHKFTENNNKLSQNKISKQQQVDNLDQEIFKLQEKLKQAQQQFDELHQQKLNQERQLNGLKMQNFQLREERAQYQNKHAALEEQVKNKQQEYDYVKHQQDEANEGYMLLSTDIQELTKLLQITKSKSNDRVMQLATEENKYREMSDRVDRMAPKLNDKQMMLDDLAIHTEKFVSENVQLMEVNSKLSYDLEALKRHIELVIEHNSNLLDELELYQQQDEKIRKILTRKQRVDNVKLQQDEKMRNTLMIIQDQTADDNYGTK